MWAKPWVFLNFASISGSTVQVLYVKYLFIYATSLFSAEASFSSLFSDQTRSLPSFQQTGALSPIQCHQPLSLPGHFSLSRSSPHRPPKGQVWYSFNIQHGAGIVPVMTIWGFPNLNIINTLHEQKIVDFFRDKCWAWLSFPNNHGGLPTLLCPRMPFQPSTVMNYANT